MTLMIATISSMLLVMLMYSLSSVQRRDGGNTLGQAAAFIRFWRESQVFEVQASFGCLNFYTLIPAVLLISDGVQICCPDLLKLRL